LDLKKYLKTKGISVRIWWNTDDTDLADRRGFDD